MTMMRFTDRTSIFDRNASLICSNSLPIVKKLHQSELLLHGGGPQFESPSEIDALVRLGPMLLKYFIPSRD